LKYKDINKREREREQNNTVKEENYRKSWREGKTIAKREIQGLQFI
jgi:hypothetical protein